MGLMTVFSDESGYTGPNLTNRKQPYFVLATISLDEQEAKALRNDIFGSVRSGELKHSSLARNAKQQLMVLEYLKHLQSNPDLSKMYVVDKEFVAVTKIVDYLLETVARMVGLDIYSNGYALAFSNVFYYLLVENEVSAYRSGLLNRFEGMMRHGSMIRYNEFFDYIERPVVSSRLNEFLDPIRATRHLVNTDELLRLGPDALDVSFTCALNLMAEWRKETNEDLSLIHDVSSAMTKEIKLWEALTAKSVPPTTIGYGPKMMQFPIGVSETRFEDSRSWVGLQLADVLAGSVARTLAVRKRGESDPYVSLISETALSIKAHPIMPGTPDDFDVYNTTYVPPTDALEFLGEFYARTRPSKE